MCNHSSERSRTLFWSLYVLNAHPVLVVKTFTLKKKENALLIFLNQLFSSVFFSFILSIIVSNGVNQGHFQEL